MNMLLVHNEESSYCKTSTTCKAKPVDDIPLAVLMNDGSCSSKKTLREPDMMSMDDHNDDLSNLLLEQDLWDSVDHQSIARVQETWERLLDTTGHEALGQVLVRQMMNLQAGAQLETGSDFCTNLVNSLDSFVHLLEPGAQVEDVFDCALQIKEQGVSLELLADALPLCIKSIFGYDLTAADLEAWQQVVVPALQELELPSQLWNAPLY